MTGIIEPGENIIDFREGRAHVEFRDFSDLLKRYLKNNKEAGDLEDRLSNLFKIIFFNSEENLNNEKVEKFFINTEGEKDVTIDRLERELLAEFELVKRADNYNDRALSAVLKVKSRFIDILPISDDPNHVLQIHRFISSIFAPMVSYIEKQTQKKEADTGKVIVFPSDSGNK